MKKFRAWAKDPQTGLKTYVDAQSVGKVEFDNDGNTNEPLIANPNPKVFRVIDSGFEHYQVEEIMYAIPA